MFNFDYSPPQRRSLSCRSSVAYPTAVKAAMYIKKLTFRLLQGCLGVANRQAGLCCKLTLGASQPLAVVFGVPQMPT